MTNGRCVKCVCPEMIRSKAADYGHDNLGNDMVSAAPVAMLGIIMIVKGLREDKNG